MDPNQNLECQLDLAKQILADENKKTDDEIALAELILDLDKWICFGGFLPKRWNRNEKL